MKIKFILLLLFIINTVTAQIKEKITIPNGVVYNYADDKLNEKAKKLLTESLTNTTNDNLLGNNLIIGPTLWKRFKNIESLKAIPDSLIFHIDDIEVEGKMSKNLKDSKKIWDEVKKGISGNYQIRKANEDELKYYWSTISFDIEEPLFVLQTEDHLYILNFLKKEMKLFWLDEFPNKNAYNNPIDKGTYKTEGTIKTYKNGNEVYITDKGNKETKLEKVIFLTSDPELQKNSSVEDLQSVFEKTNKIFERLFKNSKREGKIMVQFELGEKKNEIQFAVKDDLDLELMKEFEKQVNEEKYPYTKKDTIKFQLIYKVNSYNDTE
ncbi:hypothetical protein SAMN06265171_11335 [Chryseobacterium rhizoplanae]|uniref:Uncharacterized protein n=1 Tax=Chryseobacterium rhizoplanae TaxID=1609531 RepID=A0A521FAP3_9FLAO|nr:hypothetical protein [Chryseobacterium rhizoplanae]SMO93237.1 hypothetical protein SAMN06265171_11335 [Chryseobacterium rhizoplanae]